MNRVGHVANADSATFILCRPRLRLPQLVAGFSAAVAGLLGPLLPSWALDSFALDSLATDTSIDPGLGESPPLLDTLLVVVITYFTVMLLYLWLSSFMVGAGGGSSRNAGWQCCENAGAQRPASLAPGAQQRGRSAITLCETCTHGSSRAQSVCACLCACLQVCACFHKQQFGLKQLQECLTVPDTQHAMLAGGWSVTG